MRNSPSAIDTRMPVRTGSCLIARGSLCHALDGLERRPRPKLDRSVTRIGQAREVLHGGNVRMWNSARWS